MVLARFQGGFGFPKKSQGAKVEMETHLTKQVLTKQMFTSHDRSAVYFLIFLYFFVQLVSSLMLVDMTEKIQLVW